MSVNLGEQKITDIVRTEAGSGGTGDYNELTNKPQINGVTLVGNLTTEDLNIDVSSVDAYTKSETDEKISESVSGKADTTYVNEQLNLKADKSTLESSLALKADKTDVYTKDETISAIDTEIVGKADVTYVDGQLGLKADKVDTYTKSEVDSALNNNITTINGKLDNKANKTDVYTKEETVQTIQNNITGKADTTYVDSQLTLKADKADTYTKTEIDNMFDNPTINGDTYPIGAIAPFAGTTTPQNWLLCDGREVSRETYSQLFAVIGTTWGAGDGSTSFNLPDLRDRFPVGAGSDYDLAEKGGEKEHKLTLNEMPNHDHYISNNGNSQYRFVVNASTGGNNYIVQYQSGGAETQVPYVMAEKTGGGQSHNNMPPYAGSYYIIKAKQSAGVVATVVDTLESTSATDALSANMGRKLNSMVAPVTLFEGNVTGSSPITLNDSRDNYSYIEIIATTGDADKDIQVPVVKVMKEFNKFQIVFNTSPSTGWINMNIDYSISGTKITPIALRQAYINNNKVVERLSSDLNGYGWNLHIRKVLGYK